jgi:hypothetical protein
MSFLSHAAALAAHPNPRDEIAATYGPYFRTQHYAQRYGYHCSKCGNKPTGKLDYKRDYWDDDEEPD